MTPKETFLAMPAAKRFLEIVDDPVHRLAMNTALLEFVDRLRPNADMQIAAANGYRLEGARVILDILSTLPVATKPTNPTPTPNLKHKV